MRILNKKMLSSAAAVAMFAAMPTGAFAFDAVNWVWDNEVTGGTDIDITVEADLVPTGLTQVEKLQVQIGDVSATSTVSGITNNQPAGDGAGVGTFSETFTFETDLNQEVAGNDPILPAGPIEQNGITASFDGGSTNENEFGPNMSGELTELTFSVEGTVTVDPADSLDAEVELPSIDSAATAVGNNQSINSDVATLLHDGQFLLDTNGRDVAFDEIDAVGAIAAIGLGSAFADNSHTAFAVGATALAVTGTIAKAEVDSTSEVSDILNARVDSAATSVGNNVSVNVNADGTPEGDSVLIADMTQFALADISASSSVSGVTVNNYTNLAAVNPLVGSSATAVGNNVSINVGNVGDL